MVDPKTPGVEFVQPEEIAARLRVALELLEEYTLPPESSNVIRFAIAITILLASEAPLVLSVISHDLGERILALRAQRGGDA